MKRNKTRATEPTQSLEDIVEIQNHQMDPGYYIGTGRVPPHISAPGNSKPLGVLCILAAGFFFALGLIVIFSDIHTNKIVTVITFNAIALFCLRMGFVYFRKAKKRTKKTPRTKPKK